MIPASEDRQAAGTAVGGQMLDLARGWLGPMGPVAGVELTVNEFMAAGQCLLGHMYENRIPGDAALLGLGSAIGAMLAQQDPRVQQALLAALQAGINKGLVEARDTFRPRGTA